MSSKADTVSAAKTSSTKVGGATATGRQNLKNLTRVRVPRAAIIATTIATTAALSWKFFVSDRHKRNVSAFYKTYDPERDYARMKSAGVFKSLEGRERPEWLNDYEKELDNAIAALRPSTNKRW